MKIQKRGRTLDERLEGSKHLSVFILDEIMVVQENVSPVKPRGNNGKVEKKTLLVAQEISFAKVLAGNDKKLRDRGVKRLKNWFRARSITVNGGNSNLNISNKTSVQEMWSRFLLPKFSQEFSDEDFMRIWKGLFYCMWMSDKPLIQEELSETISGLVHSFKNTDAAIGFVRTFFLTMSQEWKGIDVHRLEKFLMFVRRFLRQTFTYVAHHDWECQLVEQLGNSFMLSLLPDEKHPEISPALGLVFHFTEIYLEELAKVSKGDLSGKVLQLLLKPFAVHLAVCQEGRLRGQITRHIFRRLLEQTTLGQEYHEKYQAWRRLGFPGGSIDAMQLVEENEEEAEIEDDDMPEGIDSQVLDPRAGHVNVDLPSIEFDAQVVIDLLKEHRFKRYTTGKTRKQLAKLIKKYQTFATGVFPYGAKDIREVPTEKLREMTEDAAEDWVNFTEELVNDDHDSSKVDDNVGSDVEMESEDEENEEEEEEEDDDDNDDDDDSNEEEEDDDMEDDDEGDGDEESDDENQLNDEENESTESDEDSQLKAPFVNGRKSKIQTSNMKGSQKGSLKSNLTENKTSKSENGRVQESSAAKAKSLKAAVKHQGNKEEETQKVPPIATPNKQILVKRKDIADSAASSDKKKAITLKRRHSTSSDFTVAKQAENRNEMDAVSGVDTLLKRLAPLGAKNTKMRRKSLPQKFEVSEVTGKSVDTVKLPESESKKKKKDPWDEPLKEGETEIVITRPTLAARRKSLEIANGSLQEVTPLRVKNPFGSHIKSSNTPGSSSKKVNFVLQRNTAQATSEYFKTLRENPNIPYDASKKPSHGVLKPSPHSSPINPFYKRKLKM